MSIEYFLHTFQDRFKNYEKHSWGLLCNQTSWSFHHKKYLFEILNQKEILKRIFIPEHGLFAELQDQVALNDASIYQNLAKEVEFVSLYGSNESTLNANSSELNDLQTLLIDIQDVGSRYYTFATTLAYLFEKIAKLKLDINVIVIERPNPAGRQVEGSALPKKFESFVGFPGIPHRHGLTIGELARYYKDFFNATFNLEIIFDSNRVEDLFSATPSNMNTAFQIAPSPNMPTSFTPFLYSGQCLLEGTSLSEGRGTTRPFEIFGAPGLHKNLIDKMPETNGVVLRPLRFLPTFQKHANQVCDGWQLHITDHRKYHSLLHSLQIIKKIKKSYEDFFWRNEEYEFRSDRPAIEILVGDQILLDFLHNKSSLSDICNYLHDAEEKWIKNCENWKLHNFPLLRVQT